MKLFIIAFIAFMNPEIVIIDFSKTSEISNWTIVNDGVMGGRSKGDFAYDESGYAVFTGTISLENNGGFSSVRYNFPEKSVDGYSMICLRVRGDKKKYQVRVRTHKYDQHAYIAHFETDGNWQSIDIPMADMYPSFRGRRLKMDQYPAEIMEEIALLFGNKKAETFRLEIDSIILK